MRQLVIPFAVALATLAAPRAQDAGPAFEVASLKRTKPLLTPTFYQVANDRLSIGNVPLRMLLQLAYGMEPQQVVGGPEWVDFERYDITARAAQPFASPGQWRAMLRALLIERFQLKVERETRPAKVLALVLARADGRLGDGLRRATTKCEELTDPSSSPGDDPCGLLAANRASVTGRMAVRGLTIDMLTRLLRSEVGQEVRDETGLSGVFDWELAFAPRQGSPSDPDSAAIFTAVQEQLGLRLEARRSTLDVIVIDHVERPAPD